MTDTAEVLNMGTAAMPFGPGFPAWLVEQADHLEVWGTTLRGDATDSTEFRLMAGETVIAQRWVDGY